MKKQLVLGLAILLTVAPAIVSHADETEELAKAAQNPVANMISLPLQLNTSLDWGPAVPTPVFVSEGKIDVHEEK